MYLHILYIDLCILKYWTRYRPLKTITFIWLYEPFYTINREFRVTVWTWAESDILLLGPLHDILYLMIRLRYEKNSTVIDDDFRNVCTYSKIISVTQCGAEKGPSVSGDGHIFNEVDDFRHYASDFDSKYFLRAFIKAYVCVMDCCNSGQFESNLFTLPTV